MDWASVGQALALIAAGSLAVLGGRPLARAMYRDPRSERFITKWLGWMLVGWGALLALGGSVVLVAQLLGVAPEEW